MINWQSILSSFDDKPTLLEWLKKVQKALNESVLKTVTASQKKSAKLNIITLSFNFKDGTKIDTPAFYIQDGEDGVGITDIANTVLSAGKISVTYDTTDGITVFADMEQFYRDKRHVSKVTYAVPLMPGSGINIDKRENTEEVEIKVDAGGFKTIFGDNSIVGRGNIDLYRHSVRVFEHTEAPEYGHCDISIVSPNNLKIDSLTDLKTVLGNTFRYPAFGQGGGNTYFILGVTENGVIGYSPTTPTPHVYSWSGWTFTDDVKTI